MMAKNFTEMTFAEFANVMRPSGAINRVTLRMLMTQGVTVYGTDAQVVSQAITLFENGELIVAELEPESEEEHGHGSGGCGGQGHGKEHGSGGCGGHGNGSGGCCGGKGR